MWLVVGLGNPGPKYAGNRHNIGFMVVDELARRAGADAWKSKFGGELAGATVGGDKVTLLKPMQYMNVSGHAVQQTAAFLKVDPAHTVVVHDELDLAFGDVRVKVGGGHGGHNGLRSICAQIGQEFVRVRCGISHPGDKNRVADYVLTDFAKSEREEAGVMTQVGADAVEEIVRKGALLSMNRFNAKQKA